MQGMSATPSDMPTSLPSKGPSSQPCTEPTSYGSVEDGYLCDFVSSTDVASKIGSVWGGADASADKCTWAGINCTGGLVTSIILDNRLITSTLPSSMGSMSSLSYLYLGANSLTGFIPSSIGNMSKLTSLYLSYNSLIGSIPSSMGSMSKLYSLLVDPNRLAGSIPSSMGSISSAWSIHLESMFAQAQFPQIWEA
jgi:Leucine-rich repeat (LRR) protein